MNGILLDTNALLWVLVDDPRLGATSRAALGDAERVYFSSVAVLEITIKEMLGRLETPGDVSDGARQAGLVELPFRSRHASGLHDLPLPARHDPFDRMLLSQALLEGLHFLTSDRRLLALKLPQVLDARD